MLMTGAASSAPVFSLAMGLPVIEALRLGDEGLAADETSKCCTRSEVTV